MSHALNGEPRMAYIGGMSHPWRALWECAGAWWQLAPATCSCSEQAVRLRREGHVWRQVETGAITTLMSGACRGGVSRTQMPMVRVWAKACGRHARGVATYCMWTVMFARACSVEPCSGASLDDLRLVWMHEPCVLCWQLQRAVSACTAAAGAS